MNEIIIGDYVLVDRPIPGIIVNIQLGISDCEFDSMNIESLTSKELDHLFVVIYYEDLGNIIYPIKEINQIITYSDYKLLMLFPDQILYLLQNCSKKCNDYIKLVRFYNKFQREAMRYIPIYRNHGKGVIEFQDGTIWFCKKFKNHRSKHKYYYVPVNKLFDYWKDYERPKYQERKAEDIYSEFYGSDEELPF